VTVLHEVLPENLHKKHTIITRQSLRTFELFNELRPTVITAAVVQYVLHRIELQHKFLQSLKMCQCYYTLAIYVRIIFHWLKFLIII